MRADRSNSCKGSPFFRRQVGMPHIHDEYKAVGGSLMPYFMFEAVVKDDEFALLPRPRIVAYS